MYSTDLQMLKRIILSKEVVGNERIRLFLCEYKKLYAVGLKGMQRCFEKCYGVVSI